MEYEESTKGFLNYCYDDDREKFFEELLGCYGVTRSTITKVKQGTYRVGNNDDQHVFKKNFLLESVESSGLESRFLELKKDNILSKNHIKIAILTDYKKVIALNVSTDEHIFIDINDIPKHWDFFMILNSKYKSNTIDREFEADIKASNKLNDLYVALIACNTHIKDDRSEIHRLNVFLSRLLFCFYSESTGIFSKNSFTSAIEGKTNSSGQNLSEFLSKIFLVLNQEKKERDPNLPQIYNDFPYVNGNLFNNDVIVPNFDRKTRKIIIECGKLNWAKINPDIFGSVFQAVIGSNERASSGSHYTSVINIMKVINPLFLDKLNEELEQANTEKDLNKLRKRLANIKFFDPACGSGNFLIIAYKEVCKIEQKLIKKLTDISKSPSFPFPTIQLSQFYGIELNDFAHEIAILSLWLAQHQSNQEFFNQFGETPPTLPLKSGAKIVCANAVRMDWQEVCSNGNNEEVYILGNPPYIGRRNQTVEQKQEKEFLFKNDIKDFKSLDYIACWFYKGYNYIKHSYNSHLAFVSTNSIIQGTQVPIMWQPILESGKIEISFAYTSFKWKNNASNNAGVTVVIIGLSCASNNDKHLYTSIANKNKNEIVIETCNNITPYLLSGITTYVSTHRQPISDDLPKMSYGNLTGGCNELLLYKEEKDALVKDNPKVKQFIRRLTGASEMLQNIERYCLWIKDKDLETALTIPSIANKIEKVRQVRLASKDKSLNKLAVRSHQFRDLNEAKNLLLVIPNVQSEKRDYIPIDFFTNEYIVSNSASVIYDPEDWVFSVISSRMHMVWVKAVGGRLKTDIRYSSTLCYNAFPFPNISDSQKEQLKAFAYKIIIEREKVVGVTLGDLYHKDKMPAGLRGIHQELDMYVESLYLTKHRKKTFTSDNERLEYLFKEYENLTTLKTNNK